jgi:hypothetical protein
MILNLKTIEFRLKKSQIQDKTLFYINFEKINKKFKKSI